MDRLVCGDVGFGKTEVAMRAAFVAAMAGPSGGVVAPTTLLARQHYSRALSERFAGFPLEIGRLSRLVPGQKPAKDPQGLTDGTMDIVIGTHAMLSQRPSVQALRPRHRRRGAALRRQSTRNAEAAAHPTSTS
jgi:transcription-repair coupling factor (superfamily II helicase)